MPPSPPDDRTRRDAGDALLALADVMTRLRAPDGCPWDAEQDLHTLRRYLVEEAHEVLEVIDQLGPTGEGDWEAHRDELRAALAEREIEVDEEGGCFLVHSAGAVRELPGFEECWFAVQDPTAASVAPRLAVEPGEGVLDLCAAPGGKTVALAEAVGPAGVVLAIDLPGARLKLLEREVKRRGLSQVAVMGADVVDPEHLPKGLKAPIRNFSK